MTEWQRETETIFQAFMAGDALREVLRMPSCSDTLWQQVQCAWLCGSFCGLSTRMLPHHRARA